MRFKFESTGNNTIDGGSSPINTRDRLVFFQDLDMTATDTSIVVGTGVNTVTNIEGLTLVGNASDNVLDASGLTTASGVELLSVLGISGNDTLVPSSDSAMIQSFDGGSGSDEFDLSNLLATPAVNITGLGNIDGDKGTFTTGGTFVSFNNVDAITLPPEYDFSAATYSMTEGNSAGTTNVVEVTRSVNTTIASSVDVVLTNGTAIAGDDFTAGPIVVNFLAGEVTKTVPIEVLGDDIVELAETISLAFANGISGAVNETANLTIGNDDTATVSIGDVSQVETDSGQTAFEFDVTLSGPVDVAVDLQAETADDSATVGDGDYNAASENISFATVTAGSQTQTVTVMINGDTNSEPDETFFVNLSALLAGGRDVTFTNTQGIGTITNDDVSNLPPQLLAISSTADFDNKAEPGDTVSVLATFTDPNATDTHTATIEWGDGTTSTGTVNQTTGEIAADYVYTTGGVFDISVTVDDGTESDTGATTAVVSGVRLTVDGILQVIGTDTRDSIHIKRKHGDIRVRSKAGHGPVGTQLFPMNDIASIVIHTCDGNDHIHLHKNVVLPTTIDAGYGNDHVIGGSGDDLIRGGDGRDLLWGGSGNDILLGGNGNDWMFGGSGRDIIVGGTGHDVAFGGSGQDILIGGSTIHDDGDLALNAIRAEWASNKSITVRKQNLLDGSGDNAGLNGTAFLDSASLIDDDQNDLLWGGWGHDWFPNY